MKRVIGLIAIILVVILSSCNLPAPSDEPQPGDQAQLPGPDDPIIKPFEATCSANDLSNYNFCQNWTCLPENYSTVSSNTPMLEWEGLSCQPNAYKISVSKMMSLNVFTGFAAISLTPNELETAIQVLPALAPGGHYMWSVTPILNGQDYLTPNSKTFFTGPLCTVQDLLAPDLVSPADNATINNMHPPCFSVMHPPVIL